MLSNIHLAVIIRSLSTVKKPPNFKNYVVTEKELLRIV